jgi:hypothetical protein
MTGFVTHSISRLHTNNAWGIRVSPSKLYAARHITIPEQPKSSSGKIYKIPIDNTEVYVCLLINNTFIVS